MSSLWWLCSTQWRRGKSTVSREGNEGTGQGGKAWGCVGVRGGADMEKAKGGKNLRKRSRITDKGVSRGWRENRGVQGKEIWDGMMQEEKGQNTIQLATMVLSPRHCQPDNGPGTWPSFVD